MDYDFINIEEKWQKYWSANKTFKAEVDHSKPIYYVLDMFPYPSGAGLHVGHPLGYIASDIFSRYKRLKGFNVLHPMGYDAFGLPAEQYAIQTGQHPAITTDINIKRYRQQLDKIGFSYDWDREFRTSDPDYYKWTQRVFIELFEHWYNNKTDKAEPIEELVKKFEKNGNLNVSSACDEIENFSSDDWHSMTENQQQKVLLNYRLAFLADTMVNWCPKLGTVLANDEVKDGLSVRGGYPAEQKRMKQWSLRISAYAERLLGDMKKLEWSDSLKEIQKNWIGRSEGAEIKFKIRKSDIEFDVFTTRPDTIFGSTFMVFAPENELVKDITTREQQEEVKKYIEATKKKTERERLTEVKTVSGAFTGAYAVHPFSGEDIPIWISDYVLAGYGTGAIMAVPAHDSRDYAFAKHFDLPIIEVVSGGDIENESYDAKEGKLINSDFLNQLDVKDGVSCAIEKIESLKIGKGKVNFRLRDAIFSRQRYWGEPFPVYFKDGLPFVIDKDTLPLELPEVDKYLPTEDGEPPLGRADNWETKEGYNYELSTMPGFAGSSAYYLRYMDSKNNDALVSEQANNYWRDVDLYIGGTEHATGHLIYSRFWNKFLFDIGWVCENEPFKKLINQGMIQGRSNFVYRIKGTNKYVSYNLKKEYDVTPIHVDVNIVENDILDVDAFKKWNTENSSAEFILENGKYICGYAVEKMSKSLYNVVNPDIMIEQYGADTLRMYEMFLGPLEMSKPWDTNGIDGVHKFLRKFWRLFHNEKNNFSLSDEKANNKELKILHKTILKIQEDIENFSFNTSVSAFMICVNELTTLKCNKKEVLEKLLILLSPFAPHITEELWEKAGNNVSVSFAAFPKFEKEYLIEDSITYPVSFNGKMRFKLELPADISKENAEEIVLNNENSQKWLDGKLPRKIIFVPKKIINIVI
ncbi:MAG: leucine--tRNA ligase [Bacteroidales bacterium]|jgi:leucyl-tRNA synthetase|nr:leucine--tRNA ligase [Bacteroidales bacterium]